MTVNLISVLNPVLVPLDEVYVGFFSQNENEGRLAGSVGWTSF